jgi:glycosyltransferase involved in cell wall biosynthesis
MRCLVAGTARNISKTWEHTKVSLSRIFKSLENYMCVIIESNSDDNSLEILKKWASEDYRRIVVSLANLEGQRTQRIATCRNEYMKYIKHEDFLLVVDLDDVLNIQDNFKQHLDSCFVRNDWDAIASNRLVEYYDMWALRCEELKITDDIFSKPRVLFQRGKMISLDTYKKYYDFYLKDLQINIPIISDWIECKSAFGGMVLYKVPAIRNKKYNGDTTCEHIEFNKGLRMFINPKFISG